MKKLLLPLFLIINGFVFGQGTPFSNYQTQGNVETRWVQQGAVQGMKGLINGIYTDTTTANLGHMDFYPGAQIFTYKPASLDSGTVWIRNYNATKWLRGGGSVDITSFTFDNDTTGVICFGNGVCDTFRINNLFDIVTNIVQNFNDSTIFNINDSTLLICTGSGSSQVCDTIHLGNSNTYYFITIGDTATAVVSCDTTVTTCVGDSCYQTTLCDTTFIPGQNPIPILHFQNGVRKLPNSLIVEHGDDAPGFGFAQLYRNTWLNTFGSQYAISGKPVGASPLLVQQTQLAQLSASIATFNHSGAYHPTWNLLDANNPVNLYFNYTDPFVIPTQGALSGDSVGYMGNRYGYLLMTNSQGSTNGFSVNDYNAKQVGIMFHTFDRFNTDGVTIFAAQVPNPYNFTTNPPTDSTLLDQRVAVFHTTHDIQFPNYPNTRNDGTAPMAFYPDADGNVKVGPVSGGSSITIINDTTFTICSFGDQLCDTFITVLADPIQYVTVINDTTLQVCDTSGNCQNVDIGGGGGGVGFDRGFFDPNQSSTGATYHQTNSYNFTVGDGATTSPSATGVFNFGNGNIVLANTVDGFVANYHNTMGGSENVVMGRNMVVRGNSNFSAGTDGTISSTSNYSASFGDANDVFCTACLTSGFGNDNYVENGFMMGSDNVNGALTAGTGTANLYSNSFILGLQSKTRGSNNIAMGTSVIANNTSGKVLAFGDNFTATTASSFNVGFSALSFEVTAAKVRINASRFEQNEAADVVAANDLVLAGGNSFTITGNTQINAITTTSWQEGSIVELHLTGTPTLKNNTAGGANTVPLRLAGAVDFTITGYTVLQLQYKDAFWNEVGRTVATGGGSGFLTADNNLTANIPTNVQLGNTTNTGSPLLHDTYLNGDVYTLYVHSSAAQSLYVYGGATSALVVSGDSQGATFYAPGVGATATSPGLPFWIIGSNSSTSAVQTALIIDRNPFGGATSDGIGAQVDFTISTTTTSGQVSNSILSKWTTAANATRTSQLDIIGVNSAATGTIASFYGSGVVGIGISSGYTATRLEVVDNAVGASSIVKVTSTNTNAASDSQKGIEATLAGANATGGQATYSIYGNNSHSGTLSESYGVYGTASNAATVYAGVFGEISSTNGSNHSAVRAVNTSTGYGLYASTTGAGTGARVIGVTGYGVDAEVTTGFGVRGVATGANGVGVIGQAQDNSGIAVEAFSTIPSTSGVGTGIQMRRTQLSGTAGAGAGISMDFVIQHDGGTAVQTGRIYNRYVSAVAASRLSETVLTTYNVGSEVSNLTLSGNGSVTLFPITATAASAITPAEGMLVFVSNTNGTFTSIGLWIYQNGAWKAL